MCVEALDHINIRTPDIEGTASFLSNALDMTVRPAPGTSDTTMGAWLYDRSGNAIIHLARFDYRFPWETDVQPIAPHGSGRLHHFALRCADYDEMAERLDRHGIEYKTNFVPVIPLRQIFVEEPMNGVMLELNFFE
jgi:catechol 2,3-dioxygenase-like lactoylglutathione lyase family enzyme